MQQQDTPIDSATITNASTGYLVEFFGWHNFFIFCSFIAIPGMILLIKIAPWNKS